MANNIEHVLCKFIVLVKTAFPRLFLSLAHLCTKTLTVTSLRSIQIGSINTNYHGHVIPQLLIAAEESSKNEY